MPMREVTRLVAVCDTCGDEMGEDEPFLFTSPRDAADLIEDDGEWHGIASWRVTPDGRVECGRPDCQPGDAP